jgi:hypothetical protein
MPSRFISLVILIYWSIAAFCLLTWDVIPELASGYPPDLRAIAGAGESSKPLRWSVQVVDDPKAPELRRTVGEAVTSSTRQRDGWFELRSQVEFDAGGLLKGTLFSTGTNMKLVVESRYHVDPIGNLRSFILRVHPLETAEALIDVQGRLRGSTMEIVSHGPVPLLNRKWSLHYEPRSVVVDILSPLDRLPGLHLGQRWETQVVNPFSGQVDRVKVEVARFSTIHWDGNPVTTLEIVQHLAPLSPRTWVRADGLILRQEVPLPFVRVVLERHPDREGIPKTPTLVPAS